MGLLASVNVRRAYEVKLDDRSIWVRAMTLGELDRMRALKEEAGLKTPFMLGVCVCHKDGTPEMPRQDGETDGDWATRIVQMLDAAQVDTTTIKQIADGIAKIGKVPGQEIMEKN